MPWCCRRFPGSSLSEAGFAVLLRAVGPADGGVERADVLAQIRAHQASLSVFAVGVLVAVAPGSQ